MIPQIDKLKNTSSGNFFLLAGPFAIEGEEMAFEIAEKIVAITNRLKIPFIFKGSYRKANRSRIDSFAGIGDEKELKILNKVGGTFQIPTVLIFKLLNKHTNNNYSSIRQLTHQ